MRAHQTRLMTLFTTTILSCWTGLAANAQTAGSADAGAAQDSQALQEVVVTSTKRQQLLEQVPASITSVSGASLEEQHVEQAVDLNDIIPGIQVRPNNNDVGLYIRGVGHPAYSPQAENSVALNQDG